MLASRTGSPRGAIAALAATALLGAGCAKLALDLTYGDQFREAEALALLPLLRSFPTVGAERP